MRGVGQNTEGSTSIVVLNEEIRFPLSARLQGVAFWDYAHIYGETGDFTGLQVRNSLGTGVRLLLPFIIVRVDYGYPLNQDARQRQGPVVLRDRAGVLKIADCRLQIRMRSSQDVASIRARARNGSSERSVPCRR